MAVTIEPLKPPVKTYFYARLDGTVFPAEHRQALQIHHHNSKYTQIGVSDGTTYYLHMTEVHKRINEQLIELEKQKKYEEITPRKYDEKIEALQLELKAEIVKAQELELEAARGHLESPGSLTIGLNQNVPGLGNADASQVGNLISRR